jgi:hypothetical protein
MWRFASGACPHERESASRFRAVRSLISWSAASIGRFLSPSRGFRISRFRAQWFRRALWCVCTGCEFLGCSVAPQPCRSRTFSSARTTWWHVTARHVQALSLLSISFTADCQRRRNSGSTILYRFSRTYQTCNSSWNTVEAIWATPRLEYIVIFPGRFE